MKLFQFPLTFLCVLLLGSCVYAQSNRPQQWCGTDQNRAELFKKNGGKDKNGLTIEEQIEKIISDHSLNNKGGINDKASPYIIPVVFHCITDNGAGYCSKASIDAQMLALNNDFKRLNADTTNTRTLFKPYAMSMNIEFRLAHIDPSGNCTEGIVRTDSPLSTDADNAVKAVSYWDSKKYFNIWVVNSIAGSGSGITLGYAQFPYSGGINNTYGVVLDNDYVSGTDRTLTHELGHCFGLLHTFQSGCGNTCSNSGDGICDTPPASNSTFGCSSTQNTCSNDAVGPDPFGMNVVDQIENYMSYDNCQNMFTLEQKIVMEGVLNSSSTTSGLNQLNTPANHAASGVANPYTAPICPPIAEFTYNKGFLCEGSSVSFTDNSYNATPTAWNWTFSGGTPSTSTSQNPTIIYSNAGTYSVTHQPSTTAGSDTETKTNIITVSSLTAIFTGAIVDDFENSTSFNNNWIINNPQGQGWQRNNTASTSGSNSVRIRNYFTSNDGEEDELISESYNVSSVSTKTMTFKQAFALKNSSNSDRLLVYYSVDCGATWTLSLPITSSTLSTAPDQTSVFVPSSSDWVIRTVNLTPIASATNVRFKFLFRSGGGNDIYIDDINVGDGNVGVEDYNNNLLNFVVYPNPANSNAKISFKLNDNVKSLSIKVRNAVGQEITNVIDGQPFNSGKYTLKIDEQRKLASGIYFIEVNADDNVQIQKLIVQ